MTENEKQFKFTRDLALLILLVKREEGYEVILADVWAHNVWGMVETLEDIIDRFGFSNDHYKSTGTWIKKHLNAILKILRSFAHSLNSFHYRKLAADLLLFKDKKYLKKTEDYEFLGKIWKSLDPENTWGGDFPSPDGNHFSRGEGKRK